MVAQEQIPTIPCAIALDNERRAVAFNRPSSLPVFIDIRNDDITAIWGEKMLNVNDREFPYNQWHSVIDTENVLHRYIKELVIADRQEPVVFHFG